MFNNKIIILLLLALTAMTVNSCFIVIEDTESDIAPSITLSPKPKIKMSDTLVRSDVGDMIAFLPSGWFFVNLEQDLSSDVIAVAVNPEYTLSAMFSHIQQSEQVKELVNKDGLVGLARYALLQKQNKSGNNVKLSGKFTEINMGTLKFCKYSFITQNSNLKAHSVVFSSILNKYYEVSLIPMNIKGVYLPTQKEIEDIFFSIVTTIQY